MISETFPSNELAPAETNSATLLSPIEGFNTQRVSCSINLPGCGNESGVFIHSGLTEQFLDDCHIGSLVIASRADPIEVTEGISDDVNPYIQSVYSVRERSLSILLNTYGLSVMLKHDENNNIPPSMWAGLLNKAVGIGIVESAQIPKLNLWKRSFMYYALRHTYFFCAAEKGKIVVSSSDSNSSKYHGNYFPFEQQGSPLQI